MLKMPLKDYEEQSGVLSAHSKKVVAMAAKLSLPVNKAIIKQAADLEQDILVTTTEYLIVGLYNSEEHTPSDKRKTTHKIRKRLGNPFPQELWDKCLLKQVRDAASEMLLVTDD